MKWGEIDLWGGDDDGLGGLFFWKCTNTNRAMDNLKLDMNLVLIYKTTWLKWLEFFKSQSMEDSMNWSNNSNFQNSSPLGPTWNYQMQTVN